MADNSIAGLILAGGQGRRVNEADKGLLLWRGKPLVAHVAQRLAPQVSQLIVSANRHIATYAAFGQVVSMISSLVHGKGRWPGWRRGWPCAATHGWSACLAIHR